MLLISITTGEVPAPEEEVEEDEDREMEEDREEEGEDREKSDTEEDVDDEHAMDRRFERNLSLSVAADRPPPPSVESLS